MFRLFFLIIVVRKTKKIIISSHLCVCNIRDEFEQKNFRLSSVTFTFFFLFGTLDLRGVVHVISFVALRVGRVGGWGRVCPRRAITERRSKQNLVRICEKSPLCVLCLENERFEHIQNPLGYFCNTSSIRTDVRDMFVSGSSQLFLLI